MFTGIIEDLGKLKKIEAEGTNRHFYFTSKISKELKADQSVSHNGVCLTVTRCEGDGHWVTAVKETLQRSNLDGLEIGSLVNLERCMVNNGRFDGHIVQGHVDQVATVRSIRDEGGSWLFEFEYDAQPGNITVEKGSIAINGVSLTCFGSSRNGFRVAIIPYTHQHTNFHALKTGDAVNLEFDIIGKYVKRLLEMRQAG
ncbi:MAG: riboflavin synthase [Bacteroidetes bacterium]|nr:riboflavin synthase [Bacteroidota bacterium]MBS1976943.1 riboflavin synthase [Bacteroidota bacterium]